MVAHIVLESALMVFGITIAGYFIGKLFNKSEQEFYSYYIVVVFIDPLQGLYNY